LPADSRSDEIALQMIACSHCGFRGIAVYEESWRGKLDTENFEHTGYRVKPENLETIYTLIQNCPDPFNIHCTCSNHQQLGQHNAHGRWIGLNKIEIMETFIMRLVI
jgi:hypothetical protein